MCWSQSYRKTKETYERLQCCNLRDLIFKNCPLFYNELICVVPWRKVSQFNLRDAFSILFLINWALTTVDYEEGAEGSKKKARGQFITFINDYLCSVHSKMNRQLDIKCQKFQLRFYHRITFLDGFEKKGRNWWFMMWRNLKFLLPFSFLLIDSIPLIWSGGLGLVLKCGRHLKDTKKKRNKNFFG